MIEVDHTINKKLILTAFEKKIQLHIKMTDGQFRNGFVTKIDPDFFSFDDRLNGVEPIFYLQLEKIEPFIDDRNNKNKGEAGDDE